MGLRKRVGRMLAEHKGRYVGIVILILLGSFYFAVATGVAGSMDRMVNGFAASHKQEDVAFTTSTPITDLPALETQSGAAIQQTHWHDVSLPGGQLRLLGAGTQVNTPAVLSGRGVEGQGEVQVDPHFLHTHGLRIGDRIDLDGRRFTIVGTVAVPDYIYILKNFYDVLPTAGFGIAVVSPSDLHQFGGAANTGPSTYSVRFEDRDNIDGQAQRLNQRLSAEGHTVTHWMAAKNNARITMPEGNISSLQSMSFPVAIAFFLLACVIVAVLVARTVKSDSVVIGTLYALGYRRRELTRHYLAIPVLIATAGGLAGTVLALPAIAPVAGWMLAAYNVPNTGVWLDPSNLLIAVLAPVALIGASSLLMIRRVLRRSPADLMNGDERAAKVNFLERALRLDRFRFTTMFRIREQLRSIPRLLFLLLGVAASSMVMLFGLTFNHSMDVATERGSLTRYNYPFEYNFTQTQNLKHDPLPAGAEPYHSIRVHPEERPSIDFYLTGIEPDSVGIKLNDTHGNDLPRNQVNITSPLATRLGLQPGDTVQLVSELNGTTYTLRVEG
ncbi:MAG: FtsX-like permease family protein, partial [Microbacterium sp.]